MRTRGFIAAIAVTLACAAAFVAACVGDDPGPNEAQQSDGGGNPTTDGTTPTTDGGDAATVALTLTASIAAPVARDGTPTQISLEVGGVDEEVVVQIVNPPTGISAVPKTILRGVTQDKIEVRADGNATPGFNTLELVASTQGGVTAKSTVRAAVLGPSGTLDPSMGDGGVMVSPFATAFGQAAVLDGDDKVVVAGNLGPPNQGQFFVMRFLLEDGAPDPTWNGGNPTVTPIGTQSDVLALARQSDGKIVAAGWSISGDAGALAAVARYDSNGMLDMPFGGTNSGFITFGLGGTNDIIRSVAVQTDGKIVVGGQAEQAGLRLFALSRLKTDGTLDTAFGPDSGVVGPYNSTLEKGGIRELAIFGTGAGERIVVAGPDGTAGSENVRVARYLLTGQPDPATQSGFTPQSIDWDGRGDQVGGLYVAPTGGIIVGAAVGSGGTVDHGYARLAPNGAFDPNFGAGGVAVASFGGIDEMESLAVQSDGKILAGGKSGGGPPQITRVLPNAPDAGDPTFNGNGGLRLPSGGGQYVVSILIQKDERILLLVNNKPFRLARVFK